MYGYREALVSDHELEEDVDDSLPLPEAEFRSELWFFKRQRQHVQELPRVKLQQRSYFKKEKIISIKKKKGIRWKKDLR